MVESLVPTNPVRVRIFLRSGAEISGLAHIKAGGYQKRISDILNLGQVKYIAVTEVEFTVLPGTGAIQTKCMLVNVEDISLVDATPPSPEDEGKSEPTFGGIQGSLPGASA